MGWWEPGRRERLSGLNVEPEKEERQLLFKLHIIKKINYLDKFINVLCLMSLLVAEVLWTV